ncbi:hypothetical protein GNY08_12545 (plasmid) [Levilactobacillus brevis]|uniref:hypothetical protein n=1 Tax=Levilactobacillus TaxID=2767886 RepID=UPI0018C06BD6|nr:hypothetical protein [Levilactobacillus brevis]QOX68406.1 hypothetical protein GNY08_12545 [Levilactobacillus brevis]
MAIFISGLTPIIAAIHKIKDNKANIVDILTIFTQNPSISLLVTLSNNTNSSNKKTLKIL